MKKRIYNHEQLKNISLDKIENESFLSVWYLSYCLFVSSAENFIVRSTSKTLDQVSNPTLKNNLRLCFFQEMQHAKSHEQFNEMYFSKNRYLRHFITLTNFLNYKMIEGIAPINLKISAAAAMEQLNAEISYFGLKNLPDISSHEPFRKVLTWHFVEEIEHRECIYDLQNELKIGRAMKTLGMGIVLFSFSFWITFLAVIISLNKSFERNNLSLIFGSQGLLHAFWQSTKRYLNKNYHPSQENIPVSFDWAERNFRNIEKT